MEGESQWGDKIGLTDRPLIMGTNILNCQPHPNIVPLMGKLDVELHMQISVTKAE
jgi:hypothetical protein